MTPYERRNIHEYGKAPALSRWLRMHYPCAATWLRAMHLLLDTVDVSDEGMGELANVIRGLPCKVSASDSISDEPLSVRRAYGVLRRQHCKSEVAYQRMRRRLERRGMLSTPQSWPCSWPGLYSFRGPTNAERFTDAIAQQMGEQFERVAMAMATYA